MIISFLEPLMNHIAILLRKELRVTEHGDKRKASLMMTMLM
jgi:hypothetical protein